MGDHHSPAYRALTDHWLTSRLVIINGKELWFEQLESLEHLGWQQHNCGQKMMTWGFPMASETFHVGEYTSIWDPQSPQSWPADDDAISFDSKLHNRHHFHFGYCDGLRLHSLRWGFCRSWTKQRSALIQSGWSTDHRKFQFAKFGAPNTNKSWRHP